MKGACWRGGFVEQNLSKIIASLACMYWMGDCICNLEVDIGAAGFCMISPPRTDCPASSDRVYTIIEQRFAFNTVQL